MVGYKKIVKFIKFNYSFTLVELLLVIALIAILAGIVILILNPAEIIKKSRDSQRFNNLSILSRAINFYIADTGGSGFYGTSSVVYISIPSNNSDCSDLGLPSLPSGWSYHCAPSSTLQNIDGSGWIPINFNLQTFGRLITRLPLDPINTTSSYYIYVYNSSQTTYELNSILESQKYKSLSLNDGGNDDNVYELGSNLYLVPTIFGYASSLNTFIKKIGFSEVEDISIHKFSNEQYFVSILDLENEERNTNILKLDTNGDIQLTKKILNTPDPIYLSETYDGGNIVTFNHSQLGTVVSRLDSSFGFLWSIKLIDLTDCQYLPVSIYESNDGGYIWIGNLSCFIGEGLYENGLIIKISSSGYIQWSKKINIEIANRIFHTIKTSNNGFILIGDYTTNDYNNYGFIIKVDFSGNIEWSKLVNNGEYLGSSIYESSDGGYIFNINNLIIKINSYGNVQWAKLVNSENYNISLTSILQSYDGGYILYGVILNGYYEDGIIISKLNSSFEVEWSKVIREDNKYYTPISIYQTQNNYYLAFGFTRDSSYWIDSVLIFKIDSSGNINNCALVNNISLSIQSSYADTQSFSLSTESINLNSEFISLSLESFEIQPSNICF